MKARVSTSVPGSAEILRALDFSPALIAQCSISEDLSIPKTFIRFPANNLVQSMDNYFMWEVGFYAGSLDNIKAAIRHGGLLLRGDISCNGRPLVEESREKRWFGDTDGVCVFTNYHDAWYKSSYNLSIGKFDCVILVVKLRPGAFSAIPSGLVSRRRASHVLYGLLVCGNGFQDQPVYPASLSIPVGISAPECRYALSCYEFLRFLNWPMAEFDETGFRCYCPSCYSDNWHSSMRVAGETYIIPKGWCRFGLRVSTLMALYNGMWDGWANAFHGTTPSSALSIIKHEQLLINGDTTLEAATVGVRSSADANQSRYFMSPHICYASHPWYSQITPFRSVGGKQFYGQVVLAMKVRLGTYQKQEETEGGAKKIFDDYSIIPQGEIEWYSACRGQ